MRRWVLAGMAAMAIAAAGCGGSSTIPAATNTATPTPDTRPGTALAKTMLLAASDAPSGWSIESGTTDTGKRPLDECTPESVRKLQTGEALGPTFTNKAGNTVSESIILYSTNGDAGNAVKGTGGVIDCYVKALKANQLSSGGAKVTAAASAPVSLASSAETTKAYEVSVTYSAGGITAKTYFTIIEVASGKAEIAIYGSGVSNAVSTTTLETFIKAATEKASSAGQS